MTLKFVHRANIVLMGQERKGGFVLHKIENLTFKGAGLPLLCQVSRSKSRILLLESIYSPILQKIYLKSTHNAKK